MPTVMVVDDEPSVREVFKHFLTTQGYLVRTAADGVEALQQVQATRPDVMLLDNNMPNLTGFEVLQHLRDSAPEVAVILMSGVLDPNTSEAARALGARACLQKPVGLPELDRCIAECLKARELPLRVLLVDDHALVRHTLALLLRQEPDVEVVGEAANGLHGLDLTRQLRPDVVLMDIRMPELDGIQATRAIHAAFPDTDVIGLSMSEKIEQAQPMLDAGAAGYVCKSDAPEVLLAAIRACRRAAPAYVAP